MFVLVNLLIIEMFEMDEVKFNQFIRHAWQ